MIIKALTSTQEMTLEVFLHLAGKIALPWGHPSYRRSLLLLMTGRVSRWLACTSSSQFDRVV